MNKTKVSRQDLTLLDEFEQDVKVVVGVLESSRKRTLKWREEFTKISLQFIPQRTCNDVIKIAESFRPVGEAIPKILRFLTVHRPEFKDRVEVGYSDIRKKIKEIVRICGQDPRNLPSDSGVMAEKAAECYGQICDLGRYIDKLSDNLRFCARTAREQQQLQKNGGQGDAESKEQPWDENNSDYMANSDAITTFTRGKMTLSALSKLLTPDGSICYMRKGQRARVHIGDFRDFASKKFVSDELANEIADEIFADREAKKEEMRRHKNKTGK